MVGVYVVLGLGLIANFFVPAEVYSGNETAEDVAGQWLARYQENNQEALMEFINFILRSAGCSAQVTIDDIGDPDNAETRIRDLQDELQAVSRVGIGTARQH